MSDGAASGEWLVEPGCIACDVSRQWAPTLIGADASGRSVVLRQPVTAEESLAMQRAAQACPAQVIRDRSAGVPPEPAFPFELTPGVFALGHNDPRSFGGHSYLVIREQGNLLIDSPRYDARLADRIDAAGGVSHVLLTHRDDVAAASQWSRRFEARVWIHAADADAAPFATDVVDGDAPRSIAPDVVLLPAPGHTRGSMAFHVGQRWLFTGDTLYWNRHRGHLDVFSEHMWFSWSELTRTVDWRLADLDVDWVFPAHGTWRQAGFAAYRAQMAALAVAMRTTDRSGWDSANFGMGVPGESS